MTKNLKIWVVVLVAAMAVLLPQTAHAQIIQIIDETMDTDSLQRAFADRHYYFGIYKDNYFIFGPPIGPKIRRDNSDVKFQVSIAQKLTKSTLPLGTYLYLFYTQKVFWNVLQPSFPMTDLNFNPGIGLRKPVFIKNRYIGNVTLQFEHESNGRDGAASRSWNRISLGASVMVDPNFIVFAKYWVPIVDGANNRDITKYCGIGQFGWQISTHDRKYMASVLLVKRAGWNLNYNFTIDFSFRLSKTANQYLYVQYYNGYGEGLLNYKQWHSQLRIGIVIKPTLFSDY